jgi:hypothetical protein
LLPPTKGISRSSLWCKDVLSEVFRGWWCLGDADGIFPCVFIIAISRFLHIHDAEYVLAEELIKLKSEQPVIPVLGSIRKQRSMS